MKPNPENFVIFKYDKIHIYLTKKWETHLLEVTT